MSQPFAHDGLFGGLNLLKRNDIRTLLNPGERPPYPILVVSPTVKETLLNLNQADVGIFIFFTLIGFPIAKRIVRIPTATEYIRRSFFKLTWTTSMTFGGFFAFTNSYYRLTGLVFNGLEWRKKENKLKKYDFTSDYMKGSIWRFFRIQEEDIPEPK